MRLNAFIGLGERLARVPAGEPFQRDDLMQEFHVPQQAISRSTFYNWFNQLQFQAVVTRRGSGFIVDRRRLIQFYAAHRVVRCRPAFEATVGTSGAQLLQHLQEQGHKNTALGFLSAANEWAFFEPRRHTELYVGRQGISALRNSLPPGDHPVQIFTENWGELPLANRPPARTNLFLTITDCHAHPEGGAHAAFLERELLWRD